MPIPTGAGTNERWRGWWPLTLAAIACAATLATIAAIRAETTSDFRDYWQTALHFRQTGEISQQLGVHNYLPFFPIFMAPWSYLPLRVAVAAFVVLSLGLLALTVVMTETLLAGDLPRRPRAATLLTLGLILPYVYSCSVLGAVGLQVMFLVVATWFLFERKREWEAGIALGLATLIKLVPGLLILFFLIRGRWRVAAAAALICLVLGLGTPLMALGLKQTIAQHHDFYQVALREHSAWATITSEHPRKIFYKNQALPAVLRRLFTPINAAPDEKGTRLFVNVADAPRGAVFTGYVVLMAAALCLSAMVGLSKGAANNSAADPRHGRAAFAAWCCLMLLASPLLWVHYLPMAYWPLALVVDRAQRQASQRAARLAAAVLMAWLLGVILLWWPTARALGAQLAALGLLWLFLLLPSAAEEHQGQ